MSQNSNNNNIGEIFILAVPDGRAGEIVQTDDYNFWIYPSLLQENLYRVQCFGQPRIEHYSCGYRRGFGRRLAFQTVHLTVQEYNDLLRWMNNLCLAFLVPDEQGHLQMIYDPLHRTNVSVVGKDEVNNKICAESNSNYPCHTPVSLLMRPDGIPMSMEEVEFFSTK